MKEQWQRVEDWAWMPPDILYPPPGYRWVKGIGWERDLAYSPTQQGDDISLNSQGHVWNTLVALGGQTISVSDFHVESRFSNHQPITLTLSAEHLDVCSEHGRVLLHEGGRVVGELCQHVRALYSEGHWSVWAAGIVQDYCTGVEIHGDANSGKLEITIRLRVGRPLAEVVYA